MLSKLYDYIGGGLIVFKKIHEEELRGPIVAVYHFYIINIFLTNDENKNSVLNLNEASGKIKKILPPFQSQTKERKFQSYWHKLQTITPETF